jgi:hemerythrin-like domain-containing protein
MTAPDLTMYRIVHRAIRGGAAVLADAAPRIERAEPARRKAFARYWKGYAGEVLHHHSVEDEIFFPALQERVPVAAELLSRTDADHQHLDELMLRIDAAVADLAAARPSPHLAELTAELDRHMTDHLDFEDRDVLPLLERHFDKDEYDVLDAEAVKSAGLGPQMAFSLPMIVGAMTPAELSLILPEAPVALRVMYRLTRGRHARLVERAFGSTPAEVSRAA